MGKQGLNDIEFLDVRRGYELEQGLTARMMEFPDSKMALKANRDGTVPIYDDIVPR
jgi:enoyl-CoA hydratase